MSLKKNDFFEYNKKTKKIPQMYHFIFKCTILLPIENLRFANKQPNFAV